MPIQLIALDLDGTLFNPEGVISQASKEELLRVIQQDVAITISTGRPLNGIPFAQLEGIPVQYAITSNGSSIYQLPERTCLYESGMTLEEACSVLPFLLERNISTSAYIEGVGYISQAEYAKIPQLDVPESIHEYLLTTRQQVPDLYEFVVKIGKPIQKLTLFFYLDGAGGHQFREDTKEHLKNFPNLTCMTGGFHNLEITQKGINKGEGLRILAKQLSIPMENTMAIGDNENDLSIITAAGIGVAMGNAEPHVKAQANYVTSTNGEEGVAKAIQKFCP